MTGEGRRLQQSLRLRKAGETHGIYLKMKRISESNQESLTTTYKHERIGKIQCQLSPVWTTARKDKNALKFYFENIFTVHARVANMKGGNKNALKC